MGDLGPPPRPRALVAGLAVSETVSWGILYYAFSVLVPAMERDLGWSRATLVGAFTVAVIVSGLGAFPVGRWLDHGSPRRLMTIGSVLGVLGVSAWSRSETIAGFYASWALIGAAMALVLYEPAQVVLIRQFGVAATRAITTVTLLAGFASTIFQPLTSALEGIHGWRATLAILAVVLGVVTVTLHAVVLPGRPLRPVATVLPTAATPVAPRDPAMVGLTVAFTLSWAAMAAAIVHLIPFLVDHGWTDFHAAVAAGALGATQVGARLVFRASANRLPIARLAVVVLAVPTAGIAVLAVSGGTTAAWLAVVMLGIGQGTGSLLRPLVLSQRLTPAAYGQGAAASAAWSTVARAVAPLALAAAAGAGRNGYPIGFAVCVLAGLAGVIVIHRSLLHPTPTPATVSFAE